MNRINGYMGHSFALKLAFRSLMLSLMLILATDGFSLDFLETCETSIELTDKSQKDGKSEEGSEELKLDEYSHAKLLSGYLFLMNKGFNEDPLNGWTSPQINIHKPPPLQV